MVENVRSSVRSPSTFTAYCSQVNAMSLWVWTTPLGRPVDPDEYSQNAMSSRWVDTGSTWSGPSAVQASTESATSGTPPVTTRTPSSFAWGSTASRNGASATTITA